MTRRGPGLYAPPEPPPPARADASGGLLSQRTIDLVQWSWSKVLPLSDAAASLFYDRLFQLDPGLRALFKSDMSEQKKKLMQTLAVAVDGLNNLTKLVPVLQGLAVRHVGYMVEEHHYDLVGQALLWALAEGLGDEFTPEVEAAWKQVYGMISDVMKTAAANHVGARPAPQPAPAQPIAPPQAAQQRATRPDTPEATAARTLVGSRLSPEPPARSDGLNPRTVELVQRSWARVLPISDAAATLFYDRLFEMDPSVRSLFKHDMAEQKKKLMQTLAVAVDGLSAPARLIPVLQALGARHAGYMVADHHYDLVGSALLWTLREGLGDGFTAEVEAAWKEVYGLIASVMKRAGAEAGQIVEPPAMLAASPRGAAAPLEPSMPLDDDAQTLHAPRSNEASLDLDAPPPLAASPAPPPVSRLAPSPRAAVAEPPPAAGGLVIPLSGQDMVVNVHVKLDSPLSRPAAAPPPAQGGLTAGLTLALLCIGASMGTSIVLSLTSSVDRTLTPLAIYGVPLALTLIVVAAFALGHAFGARRAPQDEGSAARR